MTVETRARLFQNGNTNTEARHESAPRSTQKSSTARRGGAGAAKSTGKGMIEHQLLDNPPNILVVDDDPGIRRDLGAYIAEQGYQVFSAANASEMDRLLEEHDIHIVLLDVMMPGEDGLSICLRLSGNPKLQIIMLSAKGADVDRIIGLELGADDYLAKPFNPRELLAHIRALLRRRTHALNDPDKPRDYCFLGWRVRRARHQLFTPEGVLVPLSVGEFQMLMAFIDHPQQILSRAALREALDLDDKPYTSRVVDTLVCRLRRKLELGGNRQDVILTLRSEGYMFNAAVTRQ